MKSKITLFAAVLFLALSCAAQNIKPLYEKPIHVLVFSKTVGWHHESISSGMKMLFDESKKQNWIVTATYDSKLFNDPFLSTIDVVVFLNPTGDAVNKQEQIAFEKFMKSGKGFVGIHAAADCEYDWEYYDQLNGAHFKTHPASQEATVIFENFDHPAMIPFKGMKSYTTFDEWYTFKENPRSKVHVLASLDESSIKKFENDNFRMGDHPIIWWNDEDGVRSFYTGFGHTHEAFQDKYIIEHIRNAINWAGHRID